MSPDKERAIPEQEIEPVFSEEVILLNRETVILDNVIALGYERLRHITDNGYNTRSKKLQVIIPKLQEVGLLRGSDRYDSIPGRIEGDYQIVPINLSASESVLQTGKYSINSMLVSLAQGSGVLLKIESPNSIARTIVKDISSVTIAQGLTHLNK